MEEHLSFDVSHQPYKLLMTVSATNLDSLEGALLDAIDEIKNLSLPISVGCNSHYYDFDLDVGIEHNVPHLSTAKIYKGLEKLND